MTDRIETLLHESSFDVAMEATVRVVVNDPEVFERITGPNGDEWRAALYKLYTREDVLNHLAYNGLMGTTRANQLDGWADLADDAATMQVWEVEAVI